MSLPLKYIDAWALLQSQKDAHDQLFLYKDQTVFYWTEIDETGRPLPGRNPRLKITTTPPLSVRGKKLFTVTRTADGPIHLEVHQRIPFAVDQQAPFGKLFFVRGEHIITIDNRLEYFLYRIDDECPEEPIISDYKILSRIGDGAFSFVYKCINVHDNSIKALKWMKTEPECSELLIQMFKNEDRVLSRISHSNIVSMQDFVCEGRLMTFFAMNYYPGSDLHERIVAPNLANLLTTDKIKDIFYQVITALVFLHSSEIIHRDVKPGNIFLIDRQDGSVVAKLGDFGIALDLRESNGIAVAAGSKYFAPPEVLPYFGIEEEQKCTYAVDVWSYAVSLYFALTKCYPFGKISDFDSYSEKVLNFDPDFDCDELKGVNGHVKALMMHVLHSSADDRMSSEVVLHSAWFGKD